MSKVECVQGAQAKADSDVAKLETVFTALESDKAGMEPDVHKASSVAASSLEMLENYRAGLAEDQAKAAHLEEQAFAAR